MAYSLNGTTNLGTLQTDTSLTAAPATTTRPDWVAPTGAAYVSALATHH